MMSRWHDHKTIQIGVFGVGVALIFVFLAHGYAEPPAVENKLQESLEQRRDVNRDGLFDNADESIVAASLGRCIDDAGFEPRADINRDGCVNILDVRLLRQPFIADAPARDAASAGPMELIIISPQTLELAPGDIGSVTFLIQQNTTPLFGYSIDVDFVPVMGAGDVVLADVPMTNFFDIQNLIIAGGATMDPVFSVILDTGDGGVFVSANTDDGSTVLAVDGVNDVLAQVFFKACPNASGDFSIELGPGSALSDVDGFAVPFAFTPGTITVAAGPPADIDGDCAVGIVDFLSLLASWGPCEEPCPPTCPADLDGDCEVGIVDFLALLANWG